MKSFKPRHHHIVPQLYLRNFSQDGKHVNVFDKRTGKGFSPAIKRACVVEDFYTTTGMVRVKDSAGIEHHVHDTFIESPMLESLENKYAQHLKAFIDDLNAGCTEIDSRHKENLSMHIGMQWFRSSAFRDTLGKAIGDFADQIEASVEGAEISEQLAFQIKMYRAFAAKEGAQATHLSSIIDDRIWKVFAGAVYHRDWWVFANMGDVPFYTSDNPVVVAFHNRTGGLAHITEMQTLLAFPLNPRFLLVAFSPDLNRTPFVNRVLKMNRREAIAFNGMQYEYCDRQLIVAKPDFEIAEAFQRNETVE